MSTTKVGKTTVLCQHSFSNKSRPSPARCAPPRFFKCLSVYARRAHQPTLPPWKAAPQPPLTTVGVSPGPLANARTECMGTAAYSSSSLSEVCLILSRIGFANRAVCTATATAISIFGRGPNTPGWRRLAALSAPPLRRHRQGSARLSQAKASFSGKDQAGRASCVCCSLVGFSSENQAGPGRLCPTNQAS